MAKGVLAEGLATLSFVVVEEAGTRRIMEQHPPAAARTVRHYLELAALCAGPGGDGS